MSSPKEDLWHIVYVSTCTITPEDFVQEIGRILLVSTRNNLKDDVTGLLVLDDGAFFQILEGPRETVLACLGRIKNDPRHCDIRILADAAAPRRRFTRWSMGFIDALELIDYDRVHTKLHSARHEDALEGLILVGAEHGLVQRALA